MAAGHDIFRSEELKQRDLEGLENSLGLLVRDALVAPDVVEVMLNDDGRLWIEKRGVMIPVGEMSVFDAEALLRQVATALGQTITERTPFVEGELPLDGSRFEGVARPICEKPIFAIRKKATQVYTLDDYLKAGIISTAPLRSHGVAAADSKRWQGRQLTGLMVMERLQEAIAEKLNILVVGGTGTGKTTFCNAILDGMAKLCPDDRVLLMEDTRELQCNMSNRNFLRTNEYVDMQRILRAMMRLRPDRICVGEVRGGEALALLKAWNTGHPGGVATVHASSALKGLTRIDQLIQEVSQNAQKELIGEAVNLVVYIERMPPPVGRRVKEIIRVHGWNGAKQQFEFEPWLMAA